MKVKRLNIGDCEVVQIVNNLQTVRIAFKDERQVAVSGKGRINEVIHSRIGIAKARSARV